MYLLLKIFVTYKTVLTTITRRHMSKHTSRYTNADVSVKNGRCSRCTERRHRGSWLLTIPGTFVYIFASYFRSSKGYRQLTLCMCMYEAQS